MNLPSLWNVLGIRYPSYTLPKHLISDTVKDTTIKKLLTSLKEYDYTTLLHSLNVAYYSILISFLSTSTCSHELIVTALLHDIGKQTLEHDILNKKTPLSEYEFLHIKEHVTSTYHILSSYGFKEEISLAAGQHHERLDGSGYPNGLINKDISSSARIIMIADVFDAICSERAYKKANTPAEAFLVLNNESLFDSYYVNAFSSFFRRNEETFQFHSNYLT